MLETGLLVVQAKFADPVRSGQAIILDRPDIIIG